MNTSAGQERTGPFPDRTTRDRTAGKRRRALPWRRLALAATVAAVAAWLFTGAGSDSGRVSREFASTGGRAQYVVPPGVCRIRVEAAGGSGGLQGAAGTPGLGARVMATLRVSPDETLLVHVGGQGGTAVGATPGRGGWNGGGDGGAAVDGTDGRQGRAGSGGGGATDVRRSEGRLEDRVLVAGGGGGGGGGGIGGPYGTSGGEGGSPTGHDGFAPLGSAIPRPGDAAEHQALGAHTRRERTRQRGHRDRRVARSRGPRRSRRGEWRRRRGRRTLRRRRWRRRVPMDHRPTRRGSWWRWLERRPQRDELPKRRMGEPRQRFADDQLRPDGRRMRRAGPGTL